MRPSSYFLFFLLSIFILYLPTLNKPTQSNQNRSNQKRFTNITPYEVQNLVQAVDNLSPKQKKNLQLKIKTGQLPQLNEYEMGMMNQEMDRMGMLPVEEEVLILQQCKRIYKAVYKFLLHDALWGFRCSAKIRIIEQLLEENRDVLMETLVYDYRLCFLYDLDRILC